MLDDAMIDADTPRLDPVPTLPATASPGEARCWSILGGIGHVEELLIPARDFSGLGLRMLDVARREWSDHWVNAKSGVVTAPGQTVHAMGIWDLISPGECRWRQVYSADGGKTWAHDWVMHWRRIA